MRSSSGTRVGFALHKSRSYLKACVLSRNDVSARAPLGFPGGAHAHPKAFSWAEKQSHFRRPFETETRVNRLAEWRRWRSITSIPRAFAYRIASRTMRAP